MRSSAPFNVKLYRNPQAIHLTAREREVLSLLGEGLPNKLIARRLNISTATVKIHVSNILGELGVATRLQAVIAARPLRLLDVDCAPRPDQNIESDDVVLMACAGFA